MNALPGLLQAIHDEPADEANWLVLADWLEENDDPLRAELLRLHRSLRTPRRASLQRPIERRVMEMLASGVKPFVPARTNSLGMELALIPAGSFRMGSPAREPRRMEDEHLRTVTITRSFYLGTCLVTQEQYRALMEHNPSHFSRRRKEYRSLPVDRFPVDSVTWHQAERFCEELTERERTLAEGWVYRLPTEAEWEYACRAWLSSRWPFHYGASLRPEQANFDGRYPFPPDNYDEKGLHRGRPCEVALFVPNAFGLYDMHGNLDEWCLDWHRDLDDAGDEVDPRGPAIGDEKTVRGGSWRGQGEDCRSAVRIGEDPEQGISHVGFRVELVWVGP
jgi:uncharacterized protein (TIGR02996 family)